MKSPPEKQHESRVKDFCLDLRVLDPTELIRKHITTGSPVFLDDNQYFELRNAIAMAFQLHPNEVIVVGSCRIGFSIAPSKRYRVARSNSDLDIAIISHSRFDSYWDGVFAYANKDAAWKHTKEYSQFVRMLFNGWIDPRGLPAVPSFEQAVEWTKFFDSLMRTRQFGTRRITARLYRTWSRLESYQEKAVRQCIANSGDQDA